MIKIKSKINIYDCRGNIDIGDTGQISNTTPQSSGKFPVWFDKHMANPKSAFPIWLNADDFEYTSTQKVSK